MAGALISLGDKTSHGGVVLEASPRSDIDGVGIARMGERTSCPKHAKRLSPQRLNTLAERLLQDDRRPDGGASRQGA